jgi:hypothetical protein
MKCKKCGKEMEFLKFFESLTDSFFTNQQERIKLLNHQIVICEHCFQPYGYMKHGEKLRLTLMSPAWLAKQSKKDREVIVESVKNLKANVKHAKLLKAWYERMTA